MIMFLPAVLRLFSFSLNRVVSADADCYQLANNYRGGAFMPVAPSGS